MSSAWACTPWPYIDPTAQVAEGARIGPFATVGAHSQIGPGARIGANASIAEDVVIGADLTLHAGARIAARCVIGERFIGQPNSVVGGCGFSFVTPEPSAAEDVRATLSGTREIRQQKWQRINSLGAVRIGDDVELGANSSIDRGTVRDTVIGSGSKIDSLCQIGHNVQMGEDCMMCGMAGIAGSARIGNRVLLAGKSAVNDNIFVGDDVIVGGAARGLYQCPFGPRNPWRPGHQDRNPAGDSQGPAPLAPAGRDRCRIAKGNSRAKGQLNCPCRATVPG